MTYLLALDQGTTSSRAVVYDAQLKVIASAQHPLPQYYPVPGWVEHDPIELWEGQHRAVLEALAAARLAVRDISAIGITNQRETTVLWERRSGRPLHRALVWQDRRTTEACVKLRAQGLEPLVQRKTGLLIDPYFCASKLQWLLDHCPGARTAARRGELAFGTIDTWLIWNLTGGRLHVTDASNASRTLLYNLHTGDWDEDLLRLWDIPREILPAIRDSSGVVGEANALAAAPPIAGIAGDQQAALFGQACFNVGEAKCTYGTGCFILRHAGRTAPLSTSRLLTTVAWSRGGVLEYALEGSVFMGGALVQWLRDGLGIIAHAADIEALAGSVPDSDGVVLVPAFTGLGAPHWDPTARGMLIGLTRGTTKAHIARAALDAIVLQVADVLEAMATDCGTRLSRLKVDGGAARNNLLLNLQAQILNCELQRPIDIETTARGAASLAGLGIGVWPDEQSLSALSDDAERFTPNGNLAADLAHRARWREAVARSREWAIERA